MHKFLLTVVCGLFAAQVAVAGTYVQFTAKAGDAIISVLRRYQLLEHEVNYQRFCELNELEPKSHLIAKKEYLLPIEAIDYNGRSIRTTLGKNDWALAKRIEAYNDQLHTAGLKDDDYRMDCQLWLPLHILATPVLETPVKTAPVALSIIEEPLYGSELSTVEVIDSLLAGSVYYLVAGHGGPDPGAQGHSAEHCLCEDEYAYDITLRLARKLTTLGATVHLITKDLNDGIRSGEYLKCDQDEVCHSGTAIPLSQKERLRQRVGEVNTLYAGYKKKGVEHQRLLMLHIDSRAVGQRADMFFYHHPDSNTGNKLVNTLQNTVEQKYAHYQKGRGYTGKVSGRDLFMLRESLPVAGYIELGNLKNHLDQKRLLIESNRQAVANWLAEGLVAEAK